MISLTIDRTSLALPALEIGNAPQDAGLWLPEDGVGQIDQSTRRAYAPDSAWVPGRSLLAVVREQSALPVVAYAKAATTVALATLRAEFEAALDQWDYTLTLTVDGVASTWRAEPEVPLWAGFDSGMVSARMDRASLVIPLNPA